MSKRQLYSVRSVMFMSLFPVNIFVAIRSSARTLRRYAERVCGVVLVKRSVHFGNLSALDFANGEILRMQMQQEALEKEASILRAQLMQLRVYQTSENGRTGFMVSAFITNETVALLKQCPDSQREQFKNTVAEVLVDRAIKGIYHLTSHGTMTALVFNQPKGPGRYDGRPVVSALFETAKNHVKFIDVTAPDGKVQV